MLKESVGLEDTSLATWIAAVWLFMLHSEKFNLPQTILLWTLTVTGFGHRKGIIKIVLVIAAWAYYMRYDFCPFDIPSMALTSAVVDRLLIQPVKKLCR